MKFKYLYFSFVIIAILFVFGCFSTSSKRYFQLNLSTINSNRIVKSGKLIYIKDVSVNEFYDDYRIVYKKSKYELNYYPYSFWTIKPAKMIRNAMKDFYNNDLNYSFVDKITDEKPVYFLQIYLQSIEKIEFEKTDYAHLSMVFTVFDFKNSHKIIEYKFDEKKAIKINGMRNFTRLISKILRKNIGVLLNKLIVEEGNDKKN